MGLAGLANVQTIRVGAERVRAGECILCAELAQAAARHGAGVLVGKGGVASVSPR